MAEPTVRLLAFAGSARRESFNRRLLPIAAAGARFAGAEVTIIDFRDYVMPLYDGDLEAAEGLPQAARAFKKLMIDHHGFLIAAPEYNSSITPLLKNAIDWASRPEPDEEPLVAFKGKVAGLLSASPGALGGLRGLVHVRSILGNIGVFVHPEQYALNRAGDAFNEDGTLKDDKQREMVERIGRLTAELAAKLAR